MYLELIFQVFLILSTLLCALVSGFVFAFAIVVMPGIKNLKDQEFIRAFQVMDGVIQNNQPLFIIVWVGSALALIVSTVLGIWQLDGIQRIFLIIIASIYIIGVHLPTITINIPLNNKLQAIDTNSANETTQKAIRSNFEPRWNFWNSFRTVLSSLVTVLLLVLLYKL
jgi:uncharacterized membrane protein